MYKVKLSPYHKIFYNEWKIAPEEGRYNLVFDQTISNNLSIPRLKRALTRLISEYVILNSHVTCIEEELYWKKNIKINKLIYFPYVDVNEIYNYISQPFDLENEPLYRFAIFNDANNSYRLVFVFHHILLDGASFDEIISEIGRYYNDHRYKTQVSTDQQIKLIILNNNKLWKQLNLHSKQNKIFWKDKLLEIDPINLRFIKKVDSTNEPRNNIVEELHFNFTAEIYEKLEVLQNKYGLSTYRYGQIIFAILLYRYTLQEKLAICYAVAIKECRGLIHGVGVNTNVIPYKMDALSRISDLIAQAGTFIKELNQGAVRHGYYSINQIMEGKNKEILDVMFSQTNLKDFAFNFDNVVTIRVNHEFNIDLSCKLFFEQEVNGKKVNYRVRYNISEIDGTVLNQFIRHYQKLFLEILDDLSQGISDRLVTKYPILYANEYQKIIYAWNKTQKKFSQDKTVHQLFEEQISKTPNNIALVYGNIKLTYKELNERSNQLAHYLRKFYRIKGNDLIALCLNRSEYMLVAILGILKSGAAYVPIDPDFPVERIDYILKDTQAKVLITTGDYKGYATTRILYSDVVIIDSKKITEALKECSIGNLTTSTTSKNLAYVIYTSGTTGVPKGVLIKHSSVINYLNNINEKIFTKTRENIDFSTSIGVDLTVTTVLGSLCFGHRLYIYNGDIRDAAYYKKHLIGNKITFVKLTPSYFKFLIDILPQTKISKIVLGGEKISKLVINRICKSDLIIYDEYGPTETTVGCWVACIYRGEGIHSNLNNWSIYNNYTNYVLDANMNPLPIGSIGELYIGGSGLAEGYLNQIKLTKERFLHNPFQTKKEKQSETNARIYKTGDLVRRLCDGSIEYISRNDFQRKVNGHRIELGEIESVLFMHPGIKNSVVLVKESKNINVVTESNKYIVAYYVAENILNEASLIDHLAKKLPEYMIPQVFVHLDRLPLGINGKFDRRLLPNPKLSLSKSYALPRNDLESKISMIFGEVLNIPNHQVSIDDNIFKYGGDSITSILIINRIRQQLGFHIRIEDVFKYRTIRNLYDNVISKLGLNNKCVKILNEQGILSGEVPLSPIQEWFWVQVKSGKYIIPCHWNQSFLIKTPKLDAGILQQSIVELIKYHDSFRLAYASSTLNRKEKCKQYYTSKIRAPKLKILDLNRSNIDRVKLQILLTRWQNGFDLSTGHAYSVGYIYGYPDGSSRIFFGIHHLLVDSVSWRIITEDLQTIYNGLLKINQTINNRVTKRLDYKIDIKKINIGEDSSLDIELGPKGTSYRQWVSIVKEYSLLNQAESNYWSEVMHDYEITSKTAITKLIESEDTRNQANINLSDYHTKLLLTKSNGVYNTQINDLLLASLCGALYEFISSPILHILLEGHGREVIDKSMNINRTVGWFTAMYPVRFNLFDKVMNEPFNKTNLNENRNLLHTSDIIKIVKDTLRAVPNKGIGYGALLGYETDKLPRISFNYLGQLNVRQFDTSIKVQSLDKSHIRGQNWEIVSEKGGITISDGNYDFNVINMNGYVIDGKLQFNILSKFNKNDTDKFAKLFKDKLVELVDYTKNLDREYLTRSDVGNIISQEYLDNIQKKKDIVAVYLANSLQQGFIYHSLHQIQDPAYRVQLIFEYENEVEPELLKRAWQGAVNKYPSLRLRFAWQEELVQIVDKYQEIDWTYLDISQEKYIFQMNNIKKIIKTDRRHDYDLEAGNLVRLHLIKCLDNKYICIMSAHHAILDGWSNLLLLKFVHELYGKLVSEQADVDIETEVSYMNAQKYHQENRFMSEGFWQDQIKKIEEYPNLGGLLKKGMASTKLSEYRKIKEHKEASIKIGGANYNKLKEYGYLHSITTNAVLQYAWHKLLSVYGNVTTTVVGTTISGRNLAIDNINQSIGLYINTLPLIVKHDAEKTILEAVKDIQNSIIEMNNHSNVSLVNLQREGIRLFDSLFVYENYPVFIENNTENSMLRASSLKIKEELDYPLGLVVYEKFNNVVISLKYAGELFSKGIVKQLLDGLVNLVIQMSNSTQETKQIKGLKYVTLQDYQKIIYDWNKTEKKYPYNNTVHQLFEEQVAKTPNAIAVIFEDIELTYKELNEKANQLAHFLRESYKIQGDDLIALCLNRSKYMLIAILAGLKSGAAYVPIDPDCPIERTQYIIKDTQAKIVITDIKSYSSLSYYFLGSWNLDLRNNPEDNKMGILAIDSNELQEILGTYQVSNPEPNITSKNLAYVIYTSGTMGKPKGVMVEHDNVVSLACKNNYIEITSTDCIMQVADITFDAATFEIWGALLNGAKLYLPNNFLETLSSTELFLQNIKKYKVSILWLTKSLFDHIYLQDNKVFKSLKYLLVGGEALNYQFVKMLSNSHYKPTHFINGYGPTENTTFSCTWKVDKSELLNTMSAPIGKPLANRTVYVLSDHLEVLPIGAVGELYVGGSGLSRGYLNQPQLTKKYFVVNPFQTKKEKLQNRNNRLYKTGDLVRYLANGNLEYIDRKDLQVKIRGYRIELSEIEGALNHYPGIWQSVVIVNKMNNSKYLVAYYLADNELDEILLSAFLSTKLPQYMLPTAYIHIDRIPLTINGKLDKKMLPSPLRMLNNDYIAPDNTAQIKICTAYSKVLKLPFDQVGINHDFFRLGGNSILAIKLLYKLQQEFKISLNDIFNLRTPARIAQLETSTKNNLYYTLKQIKLVYDRLLFYEKRGSIIMQKKQLTYLQENRKIKFTKTVKNIHNVLLTGTTGHFGCHILYQLLHETSYKIYLLIRARSNLEAYSRINKKFKYYFDIGLDNFRDRIIAIAADIEKKDLGVSKRQYQSLVESIDSIIHSAALVKHYGDYATFYQTNVQATINLLELVKKTQSKDFHYISTLSVLENGYIPNYQYYIYTEDDSDIALKHTNNVYVQTKYEGELAAIRYREFGVNSNIYRVGNLAMDSENYRVQENFEENAFFTRVKTILKMGMIPTEIAKVEISPVNNAALAIIKLFNQAELNNKIYHIANPHLSDLSDLFAGYNDITVKTVEFEEFIDEMLTRLNNRIDREQIERFMLHQMWLEDIDLEQLTKTLILQNKTNTVLHELGFKWASIKPYMISDIITKSFLEERKMKKKEPIFEYLESIAELIPAPFYWLDLDGRTIGLNTLDIEAIGASSKSELIGKTPHEMYKDKPVADRLQEVVNEIIRTGKSLQTEDKIIDVTTGQTRYYSSTRAPLRNKKGEIIGIVGTAIEITAQKEAEHLKHANRKLEAENQLNQLTLEKEATETERLRLENAVQKLENDKHQAAAEEQAKFREIVGQVLHDIQSPLASLKGIVEDTASSIPEENRVILRQASMRIHDISQNMLIHFRNEQQAGEMAEPLLVSTALLEILSEKRFEHRGINIDTDIAKDVYFACIQIEPSQFKRMISNVVNNSAYAVGNKADGVVTVELKVNAEWITVVVEDNGCGMSQELIKKIENNQTVTAGKENGTGIGLTQVREVLNQNFGQLTISSEEGKYTIVMLKFPKILPPFWLAEEIKIAPTDTVVVLDDDPSIHGAWDSKLRPVITQTPEIRVMHFSEGQEAVNFINLLTEFEKEHICLLADYELLHQDINGLDVIEQTKVKRSTLVTSHYTNAEIRERAASLRVRILPKMLAFAVNINLIKNIKPGSKQVDIVWVDDARWFIKDWTQRLSHLNIDTYYDPNTFLEDVHQYPLDTKIILDRNYYDREGIGRKFLGDGLVIAKTLHEIGYTQLYMVTGETPDPSIIPDYLTVILKTDHEKIKELAKA